MHDSKKFHHLPAGKLQLVIAVMIEVVEQMSGVRQQ